MTRICRLVDWLCARTLWFWVGRDFALRFSERVETERGECGDSQEYECQDRYLPIIAGDFSLLEA